MAKRDKPKQPPARQRPAPRGNAPAAPKAERVAKHLARAGLCSRRQAEAWIQQGRVSLDGKTLTTPAVAIEDADRLRVDGRPLPARQLPRVWRYHKPTGLLTSHNDPQGRKTVFETLPEDLPRVISVGRLDLNSEGLLLLTNDGDLARYLEQPATGWTRRYRVRVHGSITQADLDRLAEGAQINGVRYGPVRARIDRTQRSNMWLTMALREGKNREIRNLCEHLGLQVNRLLRLSFGPFQLGELAAGQVEEVKRRVLCEQLGQKAAAFGLSPKPDRNR